MRRIRASALRAAEVTAAASEPIDPARTEALRVPLGPVDALPPAQLEGGADAAAITGQTAFRGKIDGVAFVRKALAEIRLLRRHQPDVRPIVVFDLDNTLFDTRARTLKALHAYDEARGTHYFQHIRRVDQVGLNGAKSAELAKTVPPELFADVQAFWLDWFWQGERFLEDGVFPKVAALAREAKRAGAEVIYLTGRVDRQHTLDELKAARLPFPDEEHLVTKGKVGANTGEFKAEWFQAVLNAPKTYVGWFMTEGCRDIQMLQTSDKRIPCVRLGFSLERGEAHRVRADTPTIPESWTQKTRRLGH